MIRQLAVMYNTTALESVSKEAAGGETEHVLREVVLEEVIGEHDEKFTDLLFVPATPVVALGG